MLEYSRTIVNINNQRWNLEHLNREIILFIVSSEKFVNIRQNLDHTKFLVNKKVYPKRERESVCHVTKNQFHMYSYSIDLYCQLEDVCVCKCIFSHSIFSPSIQC